MKANNYGKAILNNALFSFLEIKTPVYLLSTLLFIILQFTVSRAEVRHLTLETTQEIALKNNPDLVRSLYDFKSAQASYSSIHSGLYPLFTLELQTPDYSERLSEQYIYDSEGKLSRVWVPSGDFRYQSSLIMEQKLPTGGSFNISSILYKRDYYTGSGDDREEQSEYSGFLRFSVQQPIFQPNQLKTSLRRGLLDLKIARLNREIVLRELDFVVAMGYYNLVRADRRLQLEMDDFQRWGNSVAIAQDKFSSGLIPQVEVLKLQVELARREGYLAAAISAYRQTADNFKLTLGLPLEDSLVVSPEVSKLEIKTGPLKHALETRQELQIARLNLEKSEINFKKAKLSAGIDASLQAYYDFTGKEPDFLDIPDNPETDRGVSLSLKMPLFDWGQARNRIQVEEIARDNSGYNFEQSRKAFISTLLQAERDLQTVEIRLASAKLAEELALKSYDITRSRFDSGVITANELIDAQISLNQARHENLDALMDYNITVVRYRTLAYPDKIIGLK